MTRADIVKLITIAMVLLMALMIVLIIILASVPPVSRDALIHHLAVPKLWIAHGGIYEIPHLTAAYYPMNLDLLYLIPLYFGNDIAPKYIHFAFSLATAWLIYRFLSLMLGRPYALAGSLLFLTTPIILKLSITAYVDLGLVFFTTLSLFQLLAWAEKGFRFRYLAAAGVACGLAVGTKYNGLISWLLLSAVTPWLYLRRFKAEPTMKKKTGSQAKALGCGLVFMAIAGLVFLPWMIKNAIWTGNPLYPLFKQPTQTVYGPVEPGPPVADVAPGNLSIEKPQINARSSKMANHFLVRKLVYEEAWWETALIPLRIFFQGQDDNPKYFDGKLNPFLLLLPLLAFVGAAKGDGRATRSPHVSDGKILGGFSLLFLLFVFLKADMRIRYISPIVPLLTVLSMAGLKGLFAWADQRQNTLSRLVGFGGALALVGVMFGANMTYMVDQFRQVDPLSYLSGEVSRDAYIEKFRPEYAAIKHANTHLPAEAEILALFIGGRGYYSDRGMRYDEDFLKSAVARAASVKEMRAHLAAFGFTHLLVRFDTFDYWSRGFLNNIEKQLVNDFFQVRGALLFAKNGHGLYKL